MKSAATALLSCVLLVLATLVMPIAAAGQETSAELEAYSELPDGLEDWQKLAERAASVIEAAAASDSALEVLRKQLVDSRELAISAIEPLQERIERLEARARSLGTEGYEDESLAAASLVLQEAINEEVLRYSLPLGLLNGIVLQADGLIADLDFILKERTRLRLSERQLSPLSIQAWREAIPFLVIFIKRTISEITTQLALETQQEILVKKSPNFVFLFAFAVLLILFPERLVTPVAKKLGSWLGSSPPFANQTENLFTYVLLPLIGVHFIGFAFISSGLLGPRSEAIIMVLPWAVGIHQISLWLGRYLNGYSALLVDLPSWKFRSPQLAFRALGLALALHALLGPVFIVGGADAAVAGVIRFPVLFIGAVGLFFGSILILSQATAVMSDDNIPQAYTRIVYLVAFVGICAALAGALLAIVGYADLSGRIVFTGAATLILLGVSFFAQKILSSLSSALLTRIGQNTSFRESIIPILSGTLVLAVAGQLLLVIWGTSRNDLFQYWSFVADGVFVGGQRIGLGRLAAAIIMFVGLLLLTRLVQALMRYSLLPNTRLDPGAQHAVITGSGYVGLIAATLATISTLGLDLTSLAIVAGALSVGIGFGMQTVVSNFVSGIILLIERPINEGDWVEAGGVSGTVKHISVRSTQIETFDRATVVVPNTDLMSNQVTNWTLGNRFGRLRLPVGVAYGTDPRKVEKILIELASRHPDLASEPPPWVVFVEFGADALNFELRGILTDVGQILSAKSDLNFAIAERFEEEGIGIPFAQRDLWIRNLDEFKSAMNDKTDD